MYLALVEGSKKRRGAAEGGQPNNRACHRIMQGWRDKCGEAPGRMKGTFSYFSRSSFQSLQGLALPSVMELWEISSYRSNKSLPHLKWAFVDVFMASGWSLRCFFYSEQVILHSLTFHFPSWHHSFLSQHKVAWSRVWGRPLLLLPWIGAGRRALSIAALLDSSEMVHLPWLLITLKSALIVIPLLTNPWQLHSSLWPISCPLSSPQLAHSNFTDPRSGSHVTSSMKPSLGTATWWHLFLVAPKVLCGSSMTLFYTRLISPPRLWHVCMLAHLISPLFGHST